MSDYNKQAEEFLSECGLAFRADLIGSDCPPFCDDAKAGRDMDKLGTYPRKTHIHGQHYRCFLTGERGSINFDFWNSYADEEFNWLLEHRTDPNVPYAVLERAGIDPNRLGSAKRRHVTAYDLLTCITKSYPGTFEEFCSDLDYNPDSRSAERVYHGVCDEWKKVRQFFTNEELAKLQEIS